MSALNMSRRGALAGALAGAFTVAIPDAIAAMLAPTGEASGGAPGAGTHLQPLITILPDSTVHITAILSEMGQGVGTSLPLIVAEELDADWDRVVIEKASSTIPIPPVTDSGMLMAATSRSTRSWFLPLREVAARARAQLVAVAAAEWGVEAAACTTARSRVIHPDRARTLPYGALAARAIEQPAPGAVSLKAPQNFTLIGRHLGRRDVRDKVRGSAIYASDVKLPGLVHASVTHAPYGAVAIAGYERDEALADSRVHDLFVLDDTLLVAVARDTWSAMRALETAAPRFTDSPWGLAQSDPYRTRLRAATREEGRAFDVREDAPLPRPTDLTQIEADYETAFLAHATMEPMSCTAWHHDGILEMWVPTQAVYKARDGAMKATGLAEDRVIVHQTLLGGGFGRRSENDFVEEAAAIAMRVDAPVRLQWSREEDTRRDYYRSAYAMHCRGALDSEGRIAEYHASIAGPSIMRTRMAFFDGPDAPIDPTVKTGLVPEWYAMPRTGAQWVEVRPPVSIGFWRSVAHSQNLFASESFIDELAHAAGADPFDFRQTHVSDARLAAVMEKLRVQSRWDTPAPDGRARGMAVVCCYESYFGQVVEVSLEEGQIRIHRATNVIDCGLAIQPDSVIDQIEGGTIFGLSAALYGDIRIADGRAEQSSFSDYRVLLLGEAPEMDSHVIASDLPPGGVGETGTPCAAPAVANALFALTGKRLRRMPLQSALLA